MMYIEGPQWCRRLGDKACCPSLGFSTPVIVSVVHSNRQVLSCQTVIKLKLPAFAFVQAHAEKAAMLCAPLIPHDCIFIAAQFVQARAKKAADGLVEERKRKEETDSETGKMERAKARAVRDRLALVRCIKQWTAVSKSNNIP